VAKKPFVRPAAEKKSPSPVDTVFPMFY
jgi:hypothetical protein